MGSRRSWTYRSLLLLLGTTSATAKLPIKIYSTEDGLPRNTVRRVIADPRGLVWFCTPEGLSRFDGSYFTNYGMADGLPAAQVNDLLITRSGRYWVATSAGLARFEPTAQGSSRFLTYRAPDIQLQQVNSLFQDKDGAMWVATTSGVYRMRNPETGVADKLEAIEPLRGIAALCLTQGADGSLWIGAAQGIIRRTSSGALQNYGVTEGLPPRPVTALVIDAQQRVWAATEDGLCVMSASAEGYRLLHVLKRRDGLAGTRVLALHQSHDGPIWAAGFNGLSEVFPSMDGRAPEIRSFEGRANLRGEIIYSVAEDPFHNLWLGTFQSGAMKVLHSGFQSYSQLDGLGGSPVLGFFEDLKGRLHAVNGRSQVISRFEDGAFVSAQPRYGAEITNLGMRRGQIAFQDHAGDWWIATFNGLYRFTGASSIEDLRDHAPAEIYTEGQGLPSHRIFRVFEDSTGDIWVATSPAGLSKWERHKKSLRHFASVRRLEATQVNGFAEDQEGNLWISMRDGLAVYREKKFEFLGREQGLPASAMTCILIDSSGRLWFGTEKDGIGRVDRPGAAQWRIQMYSTADHLSSNSIESLVEDRSGWIYVATSRGLDRLSSQTGQIRAYGHAEGLAHGFVRAAYRDRQGHLWFGTTQGASELVPAADDEVAPLYVLINGIRVCGKRYPVSELGERTIPRFTLNCSENHLEISLSSIGAGSGAFPSFRYRLNAHRGEWVAATTDRVVNLVGLEPGTYRFEVKAVAGDGRESAVPATAEFLILPPIWARWWFIFLTSWLALAAAWSLHRRRLSRALEFERIRTRIATDLHDDVGSGLSQIAILSEVAHREGANHLPENLLNIARTARELVDSMDDVVWAIDPGHDRIDDLSHRMRRFAEDLCGARNITLTFRAPERGSMAADAYVRRELYLILKEGLNNAVRHSGCTHAAVEFRIEQHAVHLTISDNGRGFDPASSTNGRGLKSMRERARRLDGVIDWQSGPAGTSLRFGAPLRAAQGRVPPENRGDGQVRPHEHAMRFFRTASKLRWNLWRRPRSESR